MNSRVLETMDIQKIRSDFPILSRKMNGHPLVYLDNAASAQKPASVLKRMHDFYMNDYANVSRGVYALSRDSTTECDLARRKCRKLLNAREPEEILFVRGATEAINLVARAYGGKFLGRGDEVVISELEHHANIVPWQMICKERGAHLKVIPINDRGEVLIEEYQKLLSPRTRLVAVTHVSNVLGTVLPVHRITQLAHAAGAKVLIDGAQSVPHMAVDVTALDCDFYCFSGHKFYGPTGVGVLYGKRDVLESMDPYQTGGAMIASVSFDKTTFAPIPAKFEAGTPAIAEIVGLGEAIDYVQELGFSQIRDYEEELLRHAAQSLGRVPGLRMIGPLSEKTGIVSFVLEGIHPHDIGTILDQEGIAVRAGHHCAQPLMKRFGVPATVRASYAFYNKPEETDHLVQALLKARRIFA